MKKLMAILFVLFLAVPGLWITVEGLTGNAETFSDAEQRMLTGFPAEVTWDNLDSLPIRWRTTSTIMPHTGMSWWPLMPGWTIICFTLLTHQV